MGKAGAVVAELQGTLGCSSGRPIGFDDPITTGGYYQQGVHPAWIKVTAEIRVGADVGTGVRERELKDSKEGDEGKSGNHPTMGAGNDRDTASRSTNGPTTGVKDKETKTNISGAGNKDNESERNTVSLVSHDSSGS